MKLCPKCNNDHSKPGIFCSRICANSRGPRSEEIKQKISRKLKGRPNFSARGKLVSEETRLKISIANTGRKSPQKLDDIHVFIENSKMARHLVKKRVVEKNLIHYSCQICSNDGNHNNLPLVLQIDHINGINNDHRLNNLRFLCPNCHTQQETYAGKNNKRK